MIKYVDICQRTKQYRLPGRLTWEDYDGISLTELRDNLIDRFNSDNISKTKIDDIIFIEVENYFSGIII